jgi:hypothetical protein
MHRRRVLTLIVSAVLILVLLYSGEGRLTGAGAGRGTDCSVVQGPAEGRIVPVIVTCDWPVPATNIHKLISDFGSHEAYFSNLSESSVITYEDGVARVRHVHHAIGMTDREVVVEWHTERFSDGARYSWRKVPNQLLVDPDRIEVEETRGFWEVRGDDERTRVSYEMRYLPGGGLPLFLLRLFQSSGMKSVLADLRDTVDRSIIASQQVEDRPAGMTVSDTGDSDSNVLVRRHPPQWPRRNLSRAFR